MNRNWNNRCENALSSRPGTAVSMVLKCLNGMLGSHSSFWNPAPSFRKPFPPLGTPVSSSHIVRVIRVWKLPGIWDLLGILLLKELAWFCLWPGNIKPGRNAVLQRISSSFPRLFKVLHGMDWTKSFRERLNKELKLLQSHWNFASWWPRGNTFYQTSYSDF